MKNLFKINLLAFVVTLMIFSCSSDDDGGNDRASNDSSLVGTWEFKENRETTIPRTVEAPEDEDPVYIRFLGENFQGATSVNTFSGTYTTEDNVITLFFVDSTGEQETSWGNQFFFALSQGYDDDSGEIMVEYEVTGSTLLIQYDETSFLYFEKQ